MTDTVTDAIDALTTSTTALTNAVLEQTQTVNPQIAALNAAVFAPKLLGYSINTNPVEYGSTEQLMLTWGVTNAPTSQKLNASAISAAVRSQALAAPVGGWTAETAEALELFDASATQTDIDTIIITPRVPIFIGLSAAAAPSNAEIIGAQYADLDSDHIGRARTLDMTAGGYIFAAYAAPLAGYAHDLTLTSVSIGPVAIAGWTVSTIMVTLATGKQVPMHVAVLPTALPAGGAPTGVTLA